MWLLHTTTLKLHEFQGTPPPYAILSHTWTTDEVLFDQVENPDCEGKLGNQKITACCNQAKADELEYAWVDTCCIDKRSSAALSEAINSMFRWYSQAHVCYAYLADVDLVYPTRSFSESRWFERGWCLQELIAPAHVTFYDKTWLEIGTKASMLDVISQTTKIPHRALIDPESIYVMSINQRMSWASTRVTTRVEDMAYSLMGIFDVNMPLLYGEGSKAFRRLQTHILAESNDHSILAWGRGYVSEHDAMPDLPPASALASSPADFRGIFLRETEMLPLDDCKETGKYRVEIANLGLPVSLPVLRGRKGLVAVLNWTAGGWRIGFLIYLNTNTNIYFRCSSDLIPIHPTTHIEPPQAICLALASMTATPWSARRKRPSHVRLTITSGGADSPACYSIDHQEFRHDEMGVTTSKFAPSKDATMSFGPSRTDTGILFLSNACGDKCSLLIGKKDRSLWTILLDGHVLKASTERVTWVRRKILHPLVSANSVGVYLDDRPMYIVPKTRCHLRMTIKRSPTPNDGAEDPAVFTIHIAQEFGEVRGAVGRPLEALRDDEGLSDEIPVSAPSGS